MLKVDNFNPNHGEDGRFSSGGGITGKFVISEAAAKAATKDSKYKVVLYHGTLSKNAQGIADNGFDAKKNGQDTLFGQGTYLTPEYFDARSYSFNGRALDESNPPQVIKSYIDTRNPYVAEYGLNAITEAVDKATGKKGYKSDAEGYPTNIEEFVLYQREYSKQVNKLLETHDAVIIEATVVGANPMVIVKDTSKIKIFEIEHANKGMKL